MKIRTNTSKNHWIKYASIDAVERKIDLTYSKEAKPEYTIYVTSCEYNHILREFAESGFSVNFC